MKKLALTALFLLSCVSQAATVTWTNKVKQFEVQDNNICNSLKMYDNGGYETQKTYKSYKAYRVKGLGLNLTHLAFINPLNADGFKTIRNIEPDFDNTIYVESLDTYRVFFDVVDKYTVDVCVATKSS